MVCDIKLLSYSDFNIIGFKYKDRFLFFLRRPFSEAKFSFVNKMYFVNFKNYQVATIKEVSEKTGIFEDELNMFLEDLSFVLKVDEDIEFENAQDSIQTSGIRVFDVGDFCVTLNQSTFYKNYPKVLSRENGRKFKEALVRINDFAYLDNRVIYIAQVKGVVDVIERNRKFEYDASKVSAMVYEADSVPSVIVSFFYDVDICSTSGSVKCVSDDYLFNDPEDVLSEICSNEKLCSFLKMDSTEFEFMKKDFELLAGAGIALNVMEKDFFRPSSYINFKKKSFVFNDTLFTLEDTFYKGLTICVFDIKYSDVLDAVLRLNELLGDVEKDKLQDLLNVKVLKEVENV